MLQSASNILEVSVETIELFALVLVRVSTFLFLFPFAGMPGATPVVARAGLSFFVSLLVFPLLPHTGFTVYPAPVFFFANVIEQVLVGAMMGFAATFLFHFVYIGGHLIARDIGIAMGGVADPIQDEMTDEYAVLILLILSAVFLIQGHHCYFIKILFDSFMDIPLGNFAWNWKSTAQILTIMSASALIFGIKLAAPLIVLLLMTSLGMALVARVMPQMNVWIVSVPIKVVLGTLMLWQVFPLMTQLFDANFMQVQESLRLLLRSGGMRG